MSQAALLIDANLLVLFVTGTVNRGRIGTFKRTRRYSPRDFDLLLRVLGGFKTLLTGAHVMAEVSNLTDLNGAERLLARQVLAKMLTQFEEPHIASRTAASEASYNRLGLTDAAISVLAREHKCSVLTDDLDLYVSLQRQGVEAINFTHLRESGWQR